MNSALFCQSSISAWDIYSSVCGHLSLSPTAWKDRCDIVVEAAQASSRSLCHWANASMSELHTRLLLAAGAGTSFSELGRALLISVADTGSTDLCLEIWDSALLIYICT